MLTEPTAEQLAEALSERTCSGLAREWGWQDVKDCTDKCPCCGVLVQAAQVLRKRPQTNGELLRINKERLDECERLRAALETTQIATQDGFGNADHMLNEIHLVAREALGDE